MSWPKRRAARASIQGVSSPSKRSFGLRRRRAGPGQGGAGARRAQVLELADRVVRNARSVFQAFLDRDIAAARVVVRRDDEVDELDETVRREVHDMLVRDGEVDTALHLFRISREIERAGDHVANMAEDVIFLVTGEIVRHAASTG
ncbi:MAG TPA: PhoU domain-containing protein [Planctomycetota bacterium]|nr:PhoU domain-containing protein [Planctomycetota bacterium]